MRKKLLSLLTVLCLVLGMLPATAMAAEIADIAAELGYSEEEIANAVYIDEDTDLEEDVEGLVIVVAPVKVTVKGAKLATGILVAPGAKGAVVTLTESADVNAIIIMDTAEVVVEETAVAASVTVTAPETTVTVAGEVAVVNVAEEAESATVTITGTAGEVTAAAPSASIEVAEEGEVTSVAVAETAVGATVTVAEEATVAAVEVAAPDVTVEVEGTVESVAVAETATGAELVVGENAAVAEVTDATGELTVSGDGAANVEVTDTTASDEEEDKDDADEEEEEEDVNFDLPVILPEDTHMADPGIKKAPLVDHANKIPSNVLDPAYSVTVTNADADNEFKVVIKSENLYWHQNTNGVVAGWVGIAIPRPAEGTYTYYQLKYGNETTAENPYGSVKAPTNTWTENGVTYDTFYYGFPNPNFKTEEGTPYTYQLTAVKTDSADAEPEFVLDLVFDMNTLDWSGYEAEAAVASLEDEILVEEDEVKEAEIEEKEETGEVEEIEAEISDEEIIVPEIPETPEVVEESAAA